MNIKTFNRRKDDLAESERLNKSERSRLLGSQGYTIDEFEKNMRDAISKGRKKLK